MRSLHPRVAPRFVPMLAVAIAIAACGGVLARDGQAATTTAARAPVAIGQVADYQIEPGALVTMREFSPESLLWQEVSLTAHGRGLLTTLIGEVSGATRKHFTLSAAKAATLRRLVAGARHVKPPARSNPRDMLYTLYISGEPSMNIQDPAAKPLQSLINFLSGLTMSECC